jgi:thiosulfate reductase/polysulfide reductase chain A
MKGESVTRRAFLRGSAAAAAAAGVAASGEARAETVSGGGERERPRHHPPRVAREVPTTCGVCFWKCGVRGEVSEDGSLLHLRGIPEHPLSRGRLCPRGVGGLGMHTDPDRLLHPAIRRGERGEGVFRRATWTEALDAAGERLRAVVERDGPGAVAFLTHGSSEAHYGHLAQALGTPHHTHPAYDQCKGPREVGFRLTFGHELKSPEPLDIENTDCLVLIGSHLGENMHNLQVQEMVSARARGGRLVVVDPRRSTAAEKADVWLRIRPGTDIALLLAWTHVLVRDGRYDLDFVAAHCEGFEALRRHVEAATPEWAARETDLTAAEIERSARLIGDAGPHVLFHPGRHVTWYGDDTQRSRAIAILVAITGSWGARGGYYLPQKAHLPSIQETFPQVPPYPTPAPRRDPGYPFSVAVNVNGVRQATREGRIKAWVVSGTNLITTLPGRSETIDALRRLEALVVVDILPTEITQWADVLLPAASYLEREDPLVVTPSRDPFVALPRQVVEPRGESQCECWVAHELGVRLGLERYWAWDSVDAFLRRTVERHGELHGAEEGRIDWDTLWERGVVVLNEGRPIYRAGMGLGADGAGRAGRALSFPAFDGSPGTGKVRLFSPDLDAVWRSKVAANEDATGFEPLPTYYAPPAGPPGHVRLLYGRSPVHSFGRTQNTPILAGREDENAVWVSPSTAAAFGVEGAEVVEVVNQDGVREGPVKLLVTSRMRDDAVYMTHGYGRNVRQLTRAYRRGADASALTSRYVLDPPSGSTAMRVCFVRLVRPRSA